jgi:hypothetical protein
MRRPKPNKPKPQTRHTRGPSKFKRTDLTKAAKATLAAGLPVRGIHVDPVTGKITVLVGPPAALTDEPTDVSPVLPENHIRAYLWCKPDKIGVANRMSALVTAWQMASASAASFFCRLT